MDLGISGKLALVVGASKGLGRAAALELARHGCGIVAVARDGEKLDSLARELIELTRQKHYIFRGDLMEEGMLRNFLNWSAEQALSPDIVFHCMGGSWNGIKGLTSPADRYAEVWRFNLGIAIEINNAFMTAMTVRKWGRIVHTSTDATKCNSGNPPYTSSKFALEGYVKTASKQLASQGVVMTAIAPGNIHTPGIFIYDQDEAWTKAYWDKYLPIQRWGEPEEAAKLVAFLCSENAGFMPGSVVRCDGGSR